MSVWWDLGGVGGRDYEISCDHILMAAGGES